MANSHHIQLANIRKQFQHELYAAGFFDAARYYVFTPHETIKMIQQKIGQLRLWCALQISPPRAFEKFNGRVTCDLQAKTSEIRTKLRPFITS